MSGYIQESRIPLKRKADLPHDAYIACLEAENEIKRSGAKAGKPFDNEQGRTSFEGPPLPKQIQGCVYREFRAGKAHLEDPRSGGSRRLVFRVHELSGDIKAIYFTPNHYEKGSFYRII